MGKQICQLFVKFRIFFVAQSQIRLSGVTHKSKKRRTQSALVLWQVFFETSTADGPGFSHQTFAKGLEVSLGEYVSGNSAAPEIFIGACNNRDSGRIGWNRACIMCADRESEIP